MQRFELSHVLEHQMTTYPGLPGPDIGEYLTFDDSASHYAAGTEFAIGQVSMVANTGTYIDTPAHRYRHGHDLSYLLLQRCTLLPAVVIDGDGPIGPPTLAGRAVEGCAVLLRTGWDQHWGTSRRYGDPDHPHLTEAGAGWLVSNGVVLVGIDPVGIDDTSRGQRPAHTGLLGAEVPIEAYETVISRMRSVDRDMNQGP